MPKKTTVTPKEKESVVDNAEVEVKEKVKKKPNLTKEERKALRAARRANKIRKQINIDEIDGISVGTRLGVALQNRSRVTRDRRKDRIERRNRMKLVVDGEEKVVSNASKYLLDMLVEDKE